MRFQDWLRNLRDAPSTNPSTESRRHWSTTGFTRAEFNFLPMVLSPWGKLISLAGQSTTPQIFQGAEKLLDLSIQKLSLGGEISLVLMCKHSSWIYMEHRLVFLLRCPLRTLQSCCKWLRSYFVAIEYHVDLFVAIQCIIHWLSFPEKPVGSPTFPSENWSAIMHLDHPSVLHSQIQVLLFS